MRFTRPTRSGQAMVVIGAVGVLGVAAASGRSMEARQPTSTGHVAGRVVDAATGAPTAGALVTLAGAGQAMRAVVDEAGMFAFADVPAATYALTASSIGYGAISADQRSATDVGRPLTLAIGQHRDDVVLRAWRLGSIAGVVTAAAMEPQPGVEVIAIRRERHGAMLPWTTVATTTSDDRGRYRLSNLPAGDFVVMARPIQDPETPLLVALLADSGGAAADMMAAVAAGPNGAPTIDARVPIASATFYHAGSAGAATSAASRRPARPTVVTVRSGATTSAIDLHIASGRGLNVSGELVGSRLPGAGAIVRLMTANEDEPRVEVADAACDEQGRFAFSAVAPGRYEAELAWATPAVPPPAPGIVPPGTRRTAPPTTLLWARAPLTIAIGDTPSLRLDVQPAVAVAGHMTFTGGASAAAAPIDVRVIASTVTWLESVTGRTPPLPGMLLHVDGSGDFGTSAIPDAYVLRTGALPRGWTLVSATVGGHDALDEAIDVTSDLTNLVLTFSSSPLPHVTGTVMNADGTIAPGATILIFPREAAHRERVRPTSRRIRVVRPDESGAYSMSMPPGEYFVVAVDAEPPVDWQDERNLDQWSTTATPLHVVLGESPRVDVHVIK